MSLIIPAEQISFGRYGMWVQAGHGKVTCDSCGAYFAPEGCLNERGHKGLHEVKGKVVDTTGTGEFHVVRIHCGNVLCPVCKAYYVGRETDKACQKIEEASKIWGEPQHVTIGVPLRLLYLADTVEGYRKLRALLIKVARSRGLVGELIIPHPFRYGRYSFHFHLVCFVDGGYTCRNCEHTKEQCRTCDGVHGREMRGYAADGFIVKVLGERRSVWQTLHYELGHCGAIKGLKGFRVLTWSGVLSNRKMRFTYVKHRAHCSICDCEFRRVKQVRGRPIVTDMNDPNYHSHFFSSLFDEDGLPKFEYCSRRGAVVSDDSGS